MTRGQLGPCERADEPELVVRPLSRPAICSVLVGSVLLVAVAAVGFYLARHQGSDAFDRWGMARIGWHGHVTVLRFLADCGNGIVVAPVAIAAALIVWRADIRRAVACLIGPAVAGALTEFALKPWVDAMSALALQFPSGHTTGAGALVMVGIVASGYRMPWLSAPLALVLVASVAAAVVALGWHTPTQALAGSTVGLGSVLVADGMLHLVPGGHGPCHQPSSGVSGGRDRSSGR